MAIIQGHVIDLEGQPVVEAAVYMVSSPASLPDIAQLTDDQGQFTLSAPVPGNYTVGVRSDSGGFAQTDVEVSGDDPIILEVQLIPQKE